MNSFRSLVYSSNSPNATGGEPAAQRLSTSGVRVHYPNLWWGRTPLMDDNAVYRPKRQRPGIICRTSCRGLESNFMSRLALYSLSALASLGLLSAQPWSGLMVPGLRKAGERRERRSYRKLDLIVPLQLSVGGKLQ